MKKIILIILLTTLAFSFLNASIYKGQRYFQKKCLSCHGKALKFVTEKSYNEWEEYLADDGDVMYEIHEDADEATDSMKYFQSSKYRRSMKHFRDFFLEYASDTGNIPACE
ncbi:MAG: cytochrome C [Sulfurimonas sp.]|nr:cytochrome C [Sulfurimonas sp.]MDQ7061687.1 cytochrome C [Sulfurimonas sp.]